MSRVDDGQPVRVRHPVLRSETSGAEAVLQQLGRLIVALTFVAGAIGMYVSAVVYIRGRLAAFYPIVGTAVTILLVVAGILLVRFVFSQAVQILDPPPRGQP